jgi:hypothetical protein
VPVEFAGSVFGVFAAFVVAEGCTVGELVAAPVSVALAVALDVASAAADDPRWPKEGASQAESRNIAASVTA